MDDQLPPEALDRVRPVIGELLRQLRTLFTALNEDPNSAIRFSAGEDH